MAEQTTKNSKSPCNFPTALELGEELKPSLGVLEGCGCTSYAQPASVGMELGWD